MPVYKDKKTGKWFFQINYKNANGEYKQKRRSGFKTKREAQEAEHLAALELNLSSDSNLTFEELAIKYLSFKDTKVKSSSYVTIESVVRLFLIPHFKKMKAKDITSRHIIEWQKEILEKNFSHKYLKKIYHNLNAIFKHGVDFYGLRENPCKKVGGFKEDEQIKKEIQFWVYEEYKKFNDHIVDDIVYETFFMFLYYMGTRKGEALAIRWNRIDFETDYVFIKETVTFKSKEGGWRVTTPKTKYSIRRILMPKVLKKQLLKYYEYCKQFEGFNDDCFVFGIHRPLAQTTIDRKFNKYIQQAGVKKIKIHDLRHSHASLLINLGASILVVSQRLGHKDINETLNTYSHMFPSKEKEVINLIDNLEIVAA